MTIKHASRQLVGSIVLKGNKAGPSTVRLRPWGTIPGRVVDDDGQGQGNSDLWNIDGLFPKRPSCRRGHGPGMTMAWPRRPVSHQGLVPGFEDGAHASDGEKNSSGPCSCEDHPSPPARLKDLGLKPEN